MTSENEERSNAEQLERVRRGREAMGNLASRVAKLRDLDSRGKANQDELDELKRLEEELGRLEIGLGSEEPFEL